MPKNYISNSTESIRMFKSNLLEPLSKVHYTVPLYVFLPVIIYCTYIDFAHYDNNIWYYLGEFLVGIFIWTLTEYVMHRFVFHFTPHGKIMERIHFIFHGVHHDYPRDAKRLVMPPSVSIPLAILFYFLFKAIFPPVSLYAFFSGFLIGYLCYDMMHYAMHHYNFKTPALRRVQQHHMLHHYQDAYKDFGVTSNFWDKVFGSESVMKNKLTKEKIAKEKQEASV